MKFSKIFKTTTSLAILSIAQSNLALADEEEKQKKDYNKIVMEKVMVVGSDDNRSKIAGSAQIINQEQLDNYSYTDINRILKQVPGINIQEEDGFGLRPNIGLRGARSDRSADITLMEDGILIAPAPYSAPSAYYFPRVSHISGVEVRKGSSAIEFGPRTTSGAVNLISTPTPNQKKVQAKAAYGSFDTNILNLLYGDKVNNFSYLIDLTHEKSNGFKKIDVVGGDTGYSIQDIMAKFKYNTNDDADIYQSIELKLGYTQEESNETYLGLSDKDFWDDPYRRYSATQLDNMDSDHQQYQLRHFADFNNFDLTTTIYRNDFSRNWYKLAGTNSITGELNQNNLTVRANNRDYYSQGIQSIMTTNFETGKLEHDLKLSARYHMDQEDRFQRNDDYNLINGVMNLNSRGIDGDAGDRELKADAIALYASDTIKYDKLSIIPGIRYENISLSRTDHQNPNTNNKNDIDSIIPGIGTIYQFNDDFASFASVHKGFAPPTPDSQNTKEEKSINYEAGLRYNKDSFKTSLVGFYNNYSNLLVECTFSSGSDCDSGQDAINAGEVDVKGFEFELSYDLFEYFENDQFQLPLNFNYTFTDARAKNSFQSSYSAWSTVNSGDQLPYIAKNQFFIGLGLISSKWELHFNGKFNDNMRSVAGSGPISENELIKRHFIVDFASELEIYKNTRLFLNIDNIFNKTYMVSRSPDRARPGKPFAFLTGVKYSF